MTQEIRIQQVTNWFVLACAMMTSVVACGGAAIPQERLTAAEAAVRAAEVGGAPDNPKAALHLKYARDQIAEAKKLIEEDENEKAGSLLDRANVDAELALSLARVENARAEAKAALDEVKELRERQSQTH